MIRTLTLTWHPCIVAVAISLLIHGGHAVGQEIDESIEIMSDSPTEISDPVRFLEFAPTIDGVLDSNLSKLTARRFTRMIREKFEGTIPEASYRMAYGTHFFYVYIEVDADSLIYRDRAYQMGDGFHMVLAKPNPDGTPTEEFYVLACSAVDNPRMEWSRRIFWYYNVDDIFVRTSDEAKLEFHEGDGSISFELLLPWHDVHPYHPWVSESIGFNLRLVKATEPDGKVRYDVVHDDCIGWELNPRRYARLQFEEPDVAGESQTFVVADRGHISEGDSLILTAVAASDSTRDESVVIRVLAGEGEPVARNEASFLADSGLTESQFEVDTRRLIAGGYLVKWRSRTNSSEGELGLTVLPQFDDAAIRDKLNSEEIGIRKSSLTTLEFKLDEVVEQIVSTKPYETCLRPRFQLTRLQNEIDEAMTGKDPYSEKTGLVRKAYRSDLDSTLQPYMVWVPEDFDPEATYPLLVYLHGSASTEYNLSGSRKIIPEGFIALAPRGRGTSNCYTFDHAQEDIAEAMASVIDDYPIDTTEIILAGFSMGGYGVYRTFYETPEKFRALAIFSGHPDIANLWYPGNDYPDFTSTEMLKLFRDVPMFVFHGEGDRNSPYEIAEGVVAELKRLGCKVEFHPEADKGHEQASDQTYEAYYDWVSRILQQ